MKRIVSRKTVVLISVLAVLIGVGALLFAQRSRAVTPEGVVVTVQRGTIEQTVREVGAIEPFRKVELKSKVAGQVLDVLVDVGSEVKAGDVLVRLDPRDAKRQIGLAAWHRRVTGAQLDHAERVFAIKSKAHEQGALSELELALARGEVERFKAQRGADGAELTILQDALSYTELRSPIDGVVLARSIQPGEMVTPGVAALVDGKPLLVVAQVAKLLMRTELNQLDVARLEPGRAVEVRVDAVPGKVFRGEVFRIAAMAQPSERRKNANLMVFPVDVLVDASQPGASALRPGMMADISIAVAKHEAVLTVPLEALVYDGGKARLRRIDATGQREELVDVEVGARNEDLAEIVSGIDEGASIRVRPAAAKDSGES